MKKGAPSVQHHPNQEDKTGKPTYASSTKVNSSTNNALEDHVNMPRGVESTFKDELRESKKKQVKGSIAKKPKQ
jgi:hypothetical protein